MSLAVVVVVTIALFGLACLIVLIALAIAACFVGSRADEDEELSEREIRNALEPRTGQVLAYTKNSPSAARTARGTTTIRGS